LRLQTIIKCGDSRLYNRIIFTLKNNIKGRGDLHTRLQLTIIIRYNKSTLWRLAITENTKMYEYLSNTKYKLIISGDLRREHYIIQCVDCATNKI